MITPSGYLPGRHLIDAYGNGGFRFGDMSHRGSILMLPSGVHAWPVSDVSQLTDTDFAPVFKEAEAIGFLLIGVGQDMVHLPEKLRWRLREHRLTADVMTTSAAARTFNVLLAEDRRVAAALIAI